jgi:hypothetical protein
VNGRFRIGSTVYEASSILRLTLGQILDLERQTAALGRPLSWSQIKAMMQSLESVSAEAFSGHDDAPWVIALTIYASRLAAGEQVTFAEAVDFPLEDLTILPATEDHSRPGPTKARPGSGRAAAKPARPAARKSGSRSATR